MGIFDVIRSSFGGGAAISAGGSVLGIDIGSSSAKLVQFRQEKGKAILETYGEISFGPYMGTEVGHVTKLQPSEIAQALSDLMKESNVTARRAGVSIPFSSSLTSILEMPKVDPAKLKQMVPLEARKYIPVPINEVMLDWLVIPNDPGDKEWTRADSNAKPAIPNDKTEVFLVAIHNEVLNNYQTIAKTAGINVGFYELEIFGTIRSALGRGIAPVMVIDFGASSTKVYIVERGIIRASHLINIGSQELTISLTRAFQWNFDKAERMKREHGLSQGVSDYDSGDNTKIRDVLLSTLGRVFSEVNRVLLGYEKKYGKDISRVVLSGGGSVLTGFEDYVKGQVPVEVELADPFAKIETPAFLNDVLKEIGPEFAVAVGVALRQINN